VIVLDASAVIELLLGNAALRKRIARSTETLAAPHLVDVEVAHVLRRLASAGELTAARGAEAIEDLRDLDLDRYPQHDLLPRVWELRHSLTAYDAVYVALAEALRAPLLTLDARLARSSGHKARVELAPAR
jgi:predicted nucleic acid-binding protein